MVFCQNSPGWEQPVSYMLFRPIESVHTLNQKREISLDREKREKMSPIASVVGLFS